MHKQVEENVYFVKQVHEIQRQMNRIKFIKQKNNPDSYIQNKFTIFHQKDKRLLKTSGTQRNQNKQLEYQQPKSNPTIKLSHFNLDKIRNQKNIQKRKAINYNKERLQKLRKRKTQNYILMKKEKQNIKLNKKDQSLKDSFRAILNNQQIKNIKQIGKIKLFQHITKKIDQIHQDKQNQKQAKIEKIVCQKRGRKSVIILKVSFAEIKIQRQFAHKYQVCEKLRESMQCLICFIRRFQISPSPFIQVKINLMYNPLIYMLGSYYNQGQRVIQKEQNLGQIWISGFTFAHDIQKLKSNKINAVVSGVDLSFKYPENFHHLKFSLNDSQDQKVTHVFKPAFQFIQQKRKQTNVLVHCAAGISRCSVILIAYLMMKYRWTFEESLKILQTARPCCQPNMGFTKQLKQFEKQLKQKYDDS